MSFDRELVLGIHCPNCCRMIPQSNYLSHEAYCARYIRLCLQCQSLFDVREEPSQPHWCTPQGNHDDRAISNCMSRCDMLDETENTSEVSECHFCGAEMPSALSDTHRSLCFEAENSQKDHQSVLSEGQSDTLNQHSVPFQDYLDKFKRQRPEGDNIRANFSSEQIEDDTQLVASRFKKRRLQ